MRHSVMIAERNIKEIYTSLEYHLSILTSNVMVPENVVYREIESFIRFIRMNN